MKLQFLLWIHVAMDLWTRMGKLRPISQLALVVLEVKPTQVSIT